MAPLRCVAVRIASPRDRRDGGALTVFNGDMVWLVIIIDLPMLILPIYSITKRRYLRRDGVRTTGIVVRHIEKEGENSNYKVPVIAYTDETGKRFDLIPDTPTNEPIGREIAIFYLPEKPHKSMADSRKYRYLDYYFLGFFLVVTFMMIIAGIFGA